ncbi:zf-TFIIB domain-containing protein [Cognatilysobacter bugurensis]|nr:zf-TFIIB domain-containing protein [Lysobacter bugurensis]
MLCPVCKTVNLAMMDRQGIEVDYCPNCRGIWLDRGELDRLIERAEQAMPARAPAAPPPQPPPHPGHAYPPAHEHHDAYKHGKNRHKSMLGELFDF